MANAGGQKSWSLVADNTNDKNLLSHTINFKC